MAINLDAIRAKLGDLQKNTGKSEKQENKILNTWYNCQ